MERKLHVGFKPEKPLVIYDGECQFCRFWIKRWHDMTGPAVDYLSSQDPFVPKSFPEIPRQWFDESVLLVESDGTVFHGAEAACRALAANPRRRWLRRAFYDVPGLRPVSEAAYRFVSAHRPAFAAVNRFFFGPKAEQA